MNSGLPAGPNRISAVTAVFIFIFFCAIFPWAGHWHVISWDTFGYYLYLPEFFIYHDPGIRNYTEIIELIHRYEVSPTFYQVHDHPSGNHLIQYSMGMAFLYAPAFFIGHAFAWITGFPADGLSAPYEWAMLVEFFLLTAWALWLFRKLMLSFFSDRVTAVLLMVVFTGTNYLSVAHSSVSSPHAYLFALYGLFLLMNMRFHNRPKKSTATILGGLLGLISLCRPTDIILVLVVVFWNVDTVEAFRNKSKEYLTHKRGLLWIGCMIAGFLLIWTPQLMYWRKYAGAFFYNSYQNAGEGFDWFSPHTIDFLFSFRKGWFIYTPVMLLAVAGFWVLYRRNRKLFWPVFLFFLLNVYVLSSWSCWWYAGSFSQRAMVQSYPLMALPLGYLLQGVFSRTGYIRFAFFTLLFSLVILNIFQTWQAKHWILHPSRNTRAYYFAVFGKIALPPGSGEKLLVDRTLEKDPVFPEAGGYVRNYHNTFTFEKPNRCFTRWVSDPDHRVSGNRVLMIHDTLRFSEGMLISMNHLTKGTDHAWLRLKFRYYFEGSIDSIQPTLVTNLYNYKDEVYSYRGFNLEQPGFNLRPGEWHTVSIDYLTPEVRSLDDIFALTFWLRGKGAFFVDDLEFSSYIKQEE